LKVAGNAQMNGDQGAEVREEAPCSGGQFNEITLDLAKTVDCFRRKSFDSGWTSMKVLE
jgi:hypothetical protein